MATAKLTITDGPAGVVAVVESDPPIPMDGDVPNVEALTDAQAAAIFVAQQLHDAAGEGSWQTLVRANQGEQR